jgi:putative lipoprotein
VCPGITASASQASGVLKGTLTYRERIALPPASVVELWITDVTPGVIVPTVLTAQTSFKTDGRQVPLPFELRYDPKKIEPTHSYAVHAAIKSGTDILFRSASPTLVITQGHPHQVQLVLTRTGG